MATKLMLVEDDPLIQRLYLRAFELAGFDVNLTKDGTFAYENAVMFRPNVIIMDVMMPNYNGFDALKDLKTNDNTRGIPVIMVSANDDGEIINKSLRLGAERYLIKSKLDPQEIVQVINEILGRAA